MSMDARLVRLVLVFSIVVLAGATYRSPNFVVHAPTEEIAREVAMTAERCRDEIARDWLGRTFPKWSKPCEIKVKIGAMGAGGATTFAFDRGSDGQTHVFGWRMTVQGSLERVLDSVIPHEVSHTVFATHFRRPLPRWADEGAATLVEHESEQHRQRLLLGQIWNSSRRIPLRKLLAMTEYPSEMQAVMALYAEGYSLSDYLVQTGGKTRFLNFLDDAHREGWERAIAKHYRVQGIEALEKEWHGWVMAGSPRLNLPADQQLAGNGAAPRRTREPAPGNDRAVAARDDRAIVRGQSPDDGRGAKFEAPVDGRRQALNDGWIPASEPRRARPAPLAARVEYETAAAEGNAPQPIAARPSPSAGRNESASADRDWSDFPDSRSGRAQAERGFESPFSP